MKKSILLFSLLCMTMLPPIANAGEATQSTALNEAEQLLIDSIKGIKSGVSQTIDFAKDQVPDVIHQLVVYKMVAYTTWVAFGIGLVFLSLWLGNKAYKESLKSYSDCHDGVMLIGGVLSMLSGIFGLILLLSYVEVLIKITLAPKVWLLEYAAHLLKGY